MLRIPKTIYFLLFTLVGLQSLAQKKVNTIYNYSIDPKMVEDGQKLFEQNCTSCHNFTQKGIGPSLGHVVNEVNGEWIKKFIKNPVALIKKGDKRAKTLFAEYKQYMPGFPNFKKREIDEIMAFIYDNQASEGNKKPLIANALEDPIPQKILKSGLKLKLEYIGTAPTTSEKIPIARINTMVVLKGEKPRQFLSDLRGIVYEFENKKLNTYLEISKLLPNFIHTPGLASGLGSYAFHPNFYENGLFFTSHTEKAGTAKADFEYTDSIKVGLQWILTEWKVKDPKSAKFEGTPREMLRINMVSQIHGMQEIVFNPFSKKGTEDYGLLYIGLGDGGASENGFPFICNNNKTIWSSVIRIDPLGKNSKNGKYGIPKNNPFTKDKNAAGEVFCRGFRNPNRIYWSPEGKMLISDIGHKNIEELNIGTAGTDYGWPYREGTFVIDPSISMEKIAPLLKNEKPNKYSYPAIQYDHDEGNAFSAGYVYIGKSIKRLQNKYLFGDVVSGKIYFVENNDLKIGSQATIKEFDLDLSGKEVTFKEICNNPKTDLRFGEGIDGEIYVYTKTDGKMYLVIDCE